MICVSFSGNFRFMIYILSFQRSSTGMMKERIESNFFDTFKNRVLNFRILMVNTKFNTFLLLLLFVDPDNEELILFPLFWYVQNANQMQKVRKGMILKYILRFKQLLGSIFKKWMKIVMFNILMILFLLFLLFWLCMS